MMNENLPEVARAYPLTGAGDLPRVPPPIVAAEWRLDNDAVDVRQLLAMVIRRRTVVIGAFLAVVLAVVAYTWTARPVYEATARILVDPSRSANYGSSDLPVISDLMGITQARSVDTQAEIIKSPLIAKQAIRRLSAAERRTLDHKKPIRVQTFKNTDVIAISALGHDPQAVTAMANAVCDEYMDSNRQSNRREIRTAADYVQAQMVQVRERLDGALTELRDYKRRNVTVDLAAESQQKVVELGQLESELRQARGERAAGEAELKALIAPATGRRSDPVRTASNSTIDAIKGQLVKLELDHTAALQEYTPTSSEVRAIERQIADARRQLGAEALVALAQDTAPVQTQVWATEARERALSVAAVKLRGELVKLPEREYRLAQLTTDLGVLQQTYEMLNEKYQTLRISEEARLANARVISPAYAPTDPVRPRKAVNLALGIIFGLGLAMAAGALVDRFGDRIYTDQDAETSVGAPILASIPFIKQPADRSLVGGSRHTSALLEIFRILRTNIVLCDADEPPRAVAVTSAEPGEGKSLSSVNLALAMALDGKRVILMDADLRHPTLHRHFGLSKDVGFTNVVAGEMTVEDALLDGGVPNLRVLLSGPPPPNPPELLNSRAGRAVVQRLRELSDFLVVDTPPATIMTDAHVVASMVDGVVVVVAGKQSGRRSLIRSASLLRRTGARIIGVLLNKAEAGYGSEYGYYGYYSERYGKYYQNLDHSLPEAAAEVTAGKES